MEIPEIHIPDVHIPYTYVPDYGHSNVQIIGCTYYHRDTKNTGNRNLIIEDKNGVITNCPYPSFNPLDYVPDQLIITEEMPNLADESEMPTSEPPKPEIPKAGIIPYPKINKGLRNIFKIKVKIKTFL